MAMNPQLIGKTMPHGFAGSYARQPDMIVGTRPAGGSDHILFGAPLQYDDAGNVVQMGAGSTAAQFVGIAARELKSSLNYLQQDIGQYAPKEAVPVFQRGSINVLCLVGTPKLGGAVYLRVAANAEKPTAVVGGLEAEADGGNTVQLTNCQWAGAADANSVAELRILTMNNA
ncbi:MAG: hypothetical protein HFF17_00050 [Oscillospiraceae bacterium]|nr:hypothetical protein [Oscillospiraceae bacterium]